MSESSTSAVERTVTPIATAQVCGNCRTPLQGPFCHQCGQPLKSPVRELWGLARDGLGELFSLDGKFFSSLLPLLFKPGALTCEYLRGRRVSFIRPFRLYLGISIALFLAISMRGDDTIIQIEADPPSAVVTKGNPAVTAAPPMVDTATDSVPAAPPPEAASVTTDSPPATGAEPKKSVRSGKFGIVEDTDGKGVHLEFGGKQWDPRLQPIDIPWVPQWLDRFINHQLVIILENGNKIERNPKELARSMLEHLPQSMFFLLPVFALLLKMMYLFKRRLYAEHLIVALHSHSFLFLAFLLMLVSDSIGTALPTLAGSMKWLRIGLLIWLPIYLWIMQKRVYGQGWFMTTVKYSVSGILYMVLIALTIAVAFVLALRFL